MDRRYHKGTWQEERAFSPMVETRGGRTLWVAGHGALHDAAGKPLDGDFEGQARQVFANLAAIPAVQHMLAELKKTGTIGHLRDRMTTFKEFTEIAGLPEVTKLEARYGVPEDQQAQL